METAALVAAACLAVVALFQAALALGAPLGAAAWGGAHAGTLPRRLRVASGLVAVTVYPLLAVVILGAAGVFALDWIPGTGEVVMWLLAGFFVLGTLANAASRSRPERIWAVVTLVLAVCCALIALGL